MPDADWREVLTVAPLAALMLVMGIAPRFFLETTRPAVPPVVSIASRPS
jgi:NADH-quinone oxidoreductase subunit M